MYCKRKKVLAKYRTHVSSWISVRPVFWVYVFVELCIYAQLMVNACTSNFADSPDCRGGEALFYVFLFFLTHVFLLSSDDHSLYIKLYLFFWSLGSRTSSGLWFAPLRSHLFIQRKQFSHRSHVFQVVNIKQKQKSYNRIVIRFSLLRK